MAYFNRDDRTTVLLESIQDAKNIIGQVSVAEGIKEVQANRLVVAFNMILQVAQRHPDWPKPTPPEPVRPVVDALRDTPRETSDEEIPF